MLGRRYDERVNLQYTLTDGMVWVTDNIIRVTISVDHDFAFKVIGSTIEASRLVSFAMPSAGGCCIALAEISYLAVLSVVRVFSRVVETFPWTLS